MHRCFPVLAGYGHHWSNRQITRVRLSVTRTSDPELCRYRDTGFHVQGLVVAQRREWQEEANLERMPPPEGTVWNLMETAVRWGWSRNGGGIRDRREAEEDLVSHTVEFGLHVYLEIDIKAIVERREQSACPSRKAILFCFPISSSSYCTWHRVGIQHNKNTALVESNPKDSVGWSPKLCCLASWGSWRWCGGRPHASP